ncbi:MAG: S8 family serine peptidase [Verrucomicrobia bacterium]|nr:S8 family serine peptidase [Verrucomicrobiota bacterium]
MFPRIRLTLILLIVAFIAALLLVVRVATPPVPPPTAAVPGSAAAPVAAAPDAAPDTLAQAKADAARQLRPQLKKILTRRDARPQEALLTFKDADAYRRFLDRAQQLGLTVLGQVDALRTVRVRYPSLTALENDLLANGADYADITANYYISVPEIPAKAERAAVNQIPLRNGTLAFLGAAADRSTWGRGTTIAVLDSGVAPDPTFGAGRVQYLNVGAGTLPGNGAEDGHGTAVAALAAGLSADAAGVAPAASILSIRVTGTDGTSDLFTVAQAILAATDAGARIINLSLGGYQTTPFLEAAIGYAVDRGTVLVAAAGNDQAAQLAWPAADPRVISVGAVDAAGQQVAFSNSGPQLQISAPGYGVQTAWLDGQRVYIDGTSASAPLVAGAIAAVMSQNPGFTANEAWAVVRQTASDAGAPGADPDYGNGILNLDWAMNVATPGRTDPAVSAHYYDQATGQMEFIVQNRSAQAVSGLGLDVDTNGATTRYRIPDLTAGASYVVKIPVDQKALAASGSLTFTSDLVTPFGLTDANPANNHRSSRLVPPAK